jgi:hypothetical protein
MPDMGVQLKGTRVVKSTVLEVHLFFRGTYCLHSYAQRVRQANSQQGGGSRQSKSHIENVANKAGKETWEDPVAARGTRIKASKGRSSRGKGRSK